LMAASMRLFAAPSSSHPAMGDYESWNAGTWKTWNGNSAHKYETARNNCDLLSENPAHPTF